MDQNRQIYRLQADLEDYAAQGLYPFHMPGHKRRMQPAPGLPFDWDLTEVPGTDDLHEADGILREAMDRTARLCGADRTWYLVNGSTCGLLAGIRALAGQEAEVICARNCHKAVFHAIELAGFQVHWILPETDPDWGICRGITAGEVESALRRHPSSRAVILTSPTYEGILSETEEICRICHARGIPVLVDEAHGAHLLALSEAAGFPPGALAAGADLVVQSPHKTLPSLTQTALLHLKGGLVDPLRVEEELDCFETSSPSYPLMASLDGCTGILVEQGAELFQKWAERLDRFDRAVENRLHRLRILGRGEDRTLAAEHRSLDPGKILIDAAGAGMTGLQLAAVLREKYRMETEMQQGPLVLVMTSICDEEDALDRLARALLEIDAVGAPADRTGAAFSASDLRPRVYCAPGRAAALEKEEVPFSDACGRICAEYLYYYPPGIPFLAPGEVITRKILTLVEDLQAAGQYPYRHPEGLRTIRCLRD